MPTRVVRTTVVRSSGSGHDSYTWLWSILVACVALLFVIISIALPGWNGRSLFKNCGNPCLGTTILAFIAIFCIVLGIIFTVLFAKRLITSFSTVIKVSSVFLLALGAIFIVAAYMAYVGHSPNNYSFYLMVTAGVFTFISSIMVAFWLGRNWNAV